ncbi:hypothetical protein [Caballeronia sp. LZ035]|nr:hypothetical protein [Caballeronia sp. LZ035]MDR5758296.1 hypothetical protein [Caballeronia sp. LZ035]
MSFLPMRPSGGGLLRGRATGMLRGAAGCGLLSSGQPVSGLQIVPGLP